MHNLCKAILPTYGWRLLAYVTAIPVAMTSFFSIFVLPESPKWLMTQGRLDEAKQILLAVAKMNGTSMPPFRLVMTTSKDDQKEVEKEVEREVEADNALEERLLLEKESSYSYSDLLRHRPIRSVALPLSVVWFTSGFCYYGLILFVTRLYSIDTSDDNTTTCSFDYSALFINATAEVVGIAVSAACIETDLFGRTKTQFLFYFLSGLSVVKEGYLFVHFGTLFCQFIRSFLVHCYVNLFVHFWYIVMSTLLCQFIRFGTLLCQFIRSFLVRGYVNLFVHFWYTVMSIYPFIIGTWLCQFIRSFSVHCYVNLSVHF